MKETVRVACVQAESVVFDREATIDKLAGLAREAAAGGAKLALFPETFVPVYPSNRWARELAHGSDGAKLWARLARESVTLPSDRLAAAVHRRILGGAHRYDDRLAAMLAHVDASELAYTQ